ncbi:MAG: TetR/AcrR family transcriptional regulator [Alphaproteobacteria bacterium]|nr:TetR/AcrR family transcriptional regulator [Alphaproteobacteria bacterium]
MPDTSSMHERILSAAEKRVRALGFNAVSFRDLASDVGVKSSSVHYHFPQKEDLGAQLVKRYTERFQTRLDEIDTEEVGPIGALEAFIALYDEALVVGESVCLCAILGAEANSLPGRINTGIQGFFQLNTEWLSEILRRIPSSETLMTPIEIVSALEGAMIVSTVMKSREAFDATAQRIMANCKGH